MKISDITIVTSNIDKIREINKIIGTNFKVTKLNIPEIQSLNIQEVISEKAKAAYRKIKEPVLVEDISFEIKALGNLPGTFIKYFLERLGTEGTVQLIKNKKSETKVTAAVALYNGKELNIFTGIVYGTLVKKDKGTNGFGFDKVFVPNGYINTFAQMPISLKNTISHRAIALEKVKKFLKIVS